MNQFKIALLILAVCAAARGEVPILRPGAAVTIGPNSNQALAGANGTGSNETLQGVTTMSGTLAGNFIRSGTATGGTSSVQTLIDPSITGTTLAPFTGSKRLGFVAGQCNIPESYNGNHQMMSETFHIATDRITYIKLAFPNYRLAEIGSGGAATMTASVQYPTGTFTQMTFSGAVSGTAADGGTLFSDLLPVTTPIPAGAIFKVRVYCTNPTAMIFTGQCYATAGYDYSQFGASGITDMTMTSGLGGMTSSTYGFKPIAIIGYTSKPSVLIVGDSITFGAYDTPDATGDMGYGRLVGKFYGNANMGVSGDAASAFLTNNTQRIKLAPYATHVISGYGINDVNTYSAAVTGTNMSSLSALFSVPVYCTTLMPDTTSSDSFATLANQTIATVGTRRTAYNQLLRTRSIPGIAGFIEIADAVESSRDSGKWAVNGTSNWLTSDGLHPYGLTNSIVAAAVPNPFMISNQFSPTIGGPGLSGTFSSTTNFIIQGGRITGTN